MKDIYERSSVVVNNKGPKRLRGFPLIIFFLILIILFIIIWGFIGGIITSYDSFVCDIGMNIGETTFRNPSDTFCWTWHEYKQGVLSPELLKQLTR